MYPIYGRILFLPLVEFVHVCRRQGEKHMNGFDANKCFHFDRQYQYQDRIYLRIAHN